MCLKSRLLKKQQGTVLVLAIFVLVVLSMLALTLSRSNSSGALAIAQEMLTTRALLTAESGAQKFATDLFPVSGAGGGLAACAAVAATSFTAPGLPGCEYTIACSAITEGATNYYNVTSTGICGSNENTATRQLTIRLRDNI